MDIIEASELVNQYLRAEENERVRLCFTKLC